MKTISNLITMMALTGLLVSCGGGNGDQNSNNQDLPTQNGTISIRTDANSIFNQLEYKIDHPIALEDDYSNLDLFARNVNDFELSLFNIPENLLGKFISCKEKGALVEDGPTFKTKLNTRNDTLRINLQWDNSAGAKRFECQLFQDYEISEPIFPNSKLEFSLPYSLVVTDGVFDLAKKIGVDAGVVHLDYLILDNSKIYLEEKTFNLNVNHLIVRHSYVRSFPNDKEVGKDGENGLAAGSLIIAAKDSFISGLDINLPGQKGGKQILNSAKGSGRGAAGSCSSYRECEEMPYFMGDSDSYIRPECLTGRCGNRPPRCYTKWTAPANGGKGNSGATGFKGNQGGKGGSVFINSDEIKKIEKFKFNLAGGEGSEGGIGGEGGDGQPGGYCPATNRSGAGGPRGDRGATGPKGDNGQPGNSDFKCVLTGKINICNKIQGEI